MRETLLLLAAAGCVATVLLAGKTPGSRWGDVLASVLFVGAAGVLLASGV
jgi:hypothetical protein